AGIDLHDLRASYKQYLTQQLSSTPAATPDAGLLSTIPLLPALPPEISHIFTLVEKMTTKAFDVYVSIILDLTQTMMPLIETACRRTSITAITPTPPPTSPVWTPPPPASGDSTPHAGKLIDGPGHKSGSDPLSSLINTVAGAADTVDQTAQPVLDFLEV